MFFHLRGPMTQFNFVCGFACCWAVRLFACLFCCSAFVGCFAVLIPFLLSVVWPVVVLFACCLAVMFFALSVLWSVVRIFALLCVRLHAVLKCC